MYCSWVQLAVCVPSCQQRGFDLSAAGVKELLVESQGAAASFRETKDNVSFPKPSLHFNHFIINLHNQQDSVDDLLWFH